MKRWSPIIVSVLTLTFLILLAPSCKNNAAGVSSKVEVLSSGWKMQPQDKLKQSQCCTSVIVANLSMGPSVLRLSRGVAIVVIMLFFFFATHPPNKY